MKKEKIECKAVLFLKSEENTYLELAEKANFDELCDESNDSPKLLALAKKIKKLDDTLRRKSSKGEDITKQQHDIDQLTLEKDKLILKQKIQRDYIIPALEARLNSLDNLLAIKQGISLNTSTVDEEVTITDAKSPPLNNQSNSNNQHDMLTTTFLNRVENNINEKENIKLDITPPSELSNLSSSKKNSIRRK